jgi:hypothetical protein
MRVCPATLLRHGPHPGRLYLAIHINVPCARSCTPALHFSHSSACAHTLQAASDLVGEVLQRTYKGGATTSEAVGHVNSVLQALAERMTAVAASSQAHWGCPPPEAGLLPQVRPAAMLPC